MSDEQPKWKIESETGRGAPVCVIPATDAAEAEKAYRARFTNVKPAVKLKVTRVE
jgi:hypothetical protein